MRMIVVDDSLAHKYIILLILVLDHNRIQNLQGHMTDCCRLCKQRDLNESYSYCGTLRRLIGRYMMLAACGGNRGQAASAHSAQEHYLRLSYFIDELHCDIGDLAQYCSRTSRRHCHCECWGFLPAECHRGPPADDDQNGLGQDLPQLERHVLMQKAPSTWPIPRQFGRFRIVLHAFSGRRRQGDFQFYLDALLAKQKTSFIVLTVSPDIVVDSHRGNIADADVRKFWFHSIDQGWTIAFLAGRSYGDFLNFVFGNFSKSALATCCCALLQKRSFGLLARVALLLSSTPKSPKKMPWPLFGNSHFSKRCFAYQELSYSPRVRDFLELAAWNLRASFA
jgi:hypothetical protein